MGPAGEFDPSATRRRRFARDASAPAELPADVVRALRTLAPLLPESVYLGGGTALAMRLGHRASLDLDLFFHGDALDLRELEARLADYDFAVTYRGPGTLRGVLGRTNVEFLQADLSGTQRQLAPTDELAGVSVASLKDLMAMKLKVLAERGELRDYYDVMTIDEQTEVSLEDGIDLFLQRYGLDRASDALPHLIRALGYLDDSDEDESLPVSKAELTRWWRARQVKLIRRLGRR